MLITKDVTVCGGMPLYSLISVDDRMMIDKHVLLLPAQTLRVSVPAAGSELNIPLFHKSPIMDCFLKFGLKLNFKEN